MNISKRKQNRKYLKRGDIKDIAKAAGVERKTVELWLNGDIKNSSAAPFVIAKMDMRKKQQEEGVAKMLTNTSSNS